MFLYTLSVYSGEWLGLTFYGQSCVFSEVFAITRRFARLEMFYVFCICLVCARARALFSLPSVIWWTGPLTCNAMHYFLW